MRLPRPLDGLRLKMKRYAARVLRRRKIRIDGTPGKNDVQHIESLIEKYGYDELRKK